MKIKNSTILILLSFVLVLPLINGCFKVGENDPFVSIFTRKARITGQWNVNKLNSNISTVEGSTNEASTRTEIIVDGTDWERTVFFLGTDEGDSVTEGTVIDYSYYFGKNGDFTCNFQYEIRTSIQDEDSGITENKTYTITSTSEGTWNFLHKIDDYSRKERLSLVYTSDYYNQNVLLQTVSEDDEGTPPPAVLFYTNTINKKYANGEMCSIWTLDQLKNSEIIMNQNINNATSNIQGGIGETVTNTGYETQTLTKSSNSDDLTE